MGRSSDSSDIRSGLDDPVLRRRQADHLAAREPRLSPREREVAVLVAAGLTTKEIAREMGIKQSTANYHLANLYRKLRAHSRVEAANAYRRLMARPPAS